MSGGENEDQPARSQERERGGPVGYGAQPRMGMGMGIPMMGINPMMMRGGMGGLGMGMMHPGMGMMAGGMARTGGLIGLGANLLSNIFSRPSAEERPTASARMVAPAPPQPTREIEKAAVQRESEETNKRNQPPVVVNQQAAQQQRSQQPVNDPAKRDKVTSAANPWAQELKEYYKVA
jgi:predicted lipid-binding transport protein (Tim44 family)